VFKPDGTPLGAPNAAFIVFYMRRNSPHGEQHSRICRTW